MSAQITCPYCGGSQFALVDGWLKLYTDARKGPGNVWRPHFNVRTCLYCGHVALFGHTTPQNFLEEVTFQVLGPT